VTLKACRVVRDPLFQVALGRISYGFLSMMPAFIQTVGPVRDREISAVIQGVNELPGAQFPAIHSEIL
jgi:hypothetical protein